MLSPIDIAQMYLCSSRFKSKLKVEKAARPNAYETGWAETHRNGLRKHIGQHGASKQHHEPSRPIMDSHGAGEASRSQLETHGAN